jgi:hypothetical protein
MKRIGFFSFLAVLIALGLARSAKADDVVVPAGTLLQCTLDEPNFSSKTAAVGDPVLCHLSSISEFGRVVFPRGAYLGGHLEAYKDPGHFVGKGYLKIQFDRIGLPNVDLEVPAKVIGVRNYRVDRDGKIIGKGHAGRDAVEWLIPPLWPWKVVTLPARGPRPTLKGESQLTVRLMGDIAVPQETAPGWHSFGEPRASLKPQIAYPPDPATLPPLVPAGQRYSAAQPAAATAIAVRSAPEIIIVPQPSAGDWNQFGQSVITGTRSREPQITLLALKSDTVYAVTDYSLLADGRLAYVLSDGGRGSIDLSDLDWDRTTQLNSARGIHVALRSAGSN